MNPQLWSWLLAAIGVTGIALAGRKAAPWIGWTIGLTAQLLWVAYALVTGQYGFLASALAYGTVYGLNVRRALAARRPRRDTLADAVRERLAADARRAAHRLRADGHDVVADGTYLRATPADPTGALGPNATACPVCPDRRRVANPLLDGHLYLHHLRGQQ